MKQSLTDIQAKNYFSSFGTEDTSEMRDTRPHVQLVSPSFSCPVPNCLEKRGSK